MFAGYFLDVALPHTSHRLACILNNNNWVLLRDLYHVLRWTVIQQVLTF